MNLGAHACTVKVSLLPIPRVHAHPLCTTLMRRQNTVDFWAREALSAPSTSGGDNPADRVPDGSKKPYTVKEDMCFVYPVLQPDVRDTGKKGMLPWTSAGSKGCLRFAVLFANPFNRCGQFVSVF